MIGTEMCDFGCLVLTAVTDVHRGVCRLLRMKNSKHRYQCRVQRVSYKRETKFVGVTSLLYHHLVLQLSSNICILL